MQCRHIFVSDLCLLFVLGVIEFTALAVKKALMYEDINRSNNQRFSILHCMMTCRSLKCSFDEIRNMFFYVNICAFEYDLMPSLN